MTMYGRSFERWLYREVHGVDAPRASRRRQRRGPARDFRYEGWIKSLPSVVSGRLGCDPCHTVNNGMSSKGSSYSCVPLTRAEHDEYDAGRAAFEAKYGVCMRDVVRSLNHSWFAHSREVK